MADLKQKSLGELEELYKKQLAYWREKRDEHEKQATACNRKITEIESQMRHVRALTGEPMPKKLASAAFRKARRQRRQRKSPVREATLEALQNRPGQQLTTRELLKAIREDTGKGVSRQAINLNVGALEQEGLIRRDPAPRGSGARFVFSAVPSAAT